MAGDRCVYRLAETLATFLRHVINYLGGAAGLSNPAGGAGNVYFAHETVANLLN